MLTTYLQFLILKCDTFLTKINNIHPSLKFTIDKPKIEFSPFLDVKVQKVGTDFSWRKTTNTNMFINWKAKAPKIWKVGLVKYLLNRVISICNSYNDFKKETIKLKEIFQLNWYPNYLVNKIVEELEKQEVIPSKIFKRKTAINKK